MNVIEKKRSSFAEWSGVGVVLTKKNSSRECILNALRQRSDIIKLLVHFTKKCRAAAENTN